jgi:HPt (histidine-containing phosphotransfer) domain-containing protein
MFLRHGFQDFLSKPIDIMRLDGVIHRWVRNKTLEKEQEKVSEHELAVSENLPLADIFRGIDGLDISKVLDLFKGNEKSLPKIFRSYIVYIRSQLDNLSVPGPEQLERYVETVHGIKGASYSIGANKVGRQAENLEWAARQGNMDFVGGNNHIFILLLKELLADLTARLDQNGL